VFVHARHGKDTSACTPGTLGGNWAGQHLQRGTAREAAREGPAAAREPPTPATKSLCFASVLKNNELATWPSHLEVEGSNTF
jgi:hypothetical protein